MSEHRYEHGFQVAAPVGQVVDFFRDGEAWYRLNPEWEVLALERDAAGQRLKLRYERSEQEVDYCRPASADFSPSGGSIVLAGEPERRIELALTPAGDATRIDWREDFAAPLEAARRAELNLWIAASAGYLACAARRDRRARLARWLLDRFWLRMSPSARRVGLMIVGMEFLALLLFIAVLIVYRLTG